jgi:hypothetical protein
MLQVFQLFRMYITSVYLDIAKVDLVLHMLQWDAFVVVHVRGKRRGTAAGAQLVPACACSRTQAVPSITGGTI